MSDREELARGLVEALLAQQAKDRHDAPLVWVESVDAVKVDGWVNANELAEAILASDWLTAHDAEKDADVERLRGVIAEIKNLTRYTTNSRWALRTITTILAKAVQL